MLFLLLASSAGFSWYFSNYGTITVEREFPLPNVNYGLFGQGGDFEVDILAEALDTSMEEARDMISTEKMNGETIVVRIHGPRKDLGRFRQAMELISGEHSKYINGKYTIMKRQWSWPTKKPDSLPDEEDCAD